MDADHAEDAHTYQDLEQVTEKTGEERSQRGVDLLVLHDLVDTGSDQVDRIEADDQDQYRPGQLGTPDYEEIDERINVTSACLHWIFHASLLLRR